MVKNPRFYSLTSSQSNVAALLKALAVAKDRGRNGGDSAAEKNAVEVRDTTWPPQGVKR